MGVLALIVGVATGLAGFVFAYFVFVFAMFAIGQRATPFGWPLLILMFATPLIATIGGLTSYWKPLTGRALLAISAVGWIVLGLLLAYVLWQGQTTGQLSTANALGVAGIVSLPALVTLLAYWLVSRAAQTPEGPDVRGHASF